MEKIRDFDVEFEGIYYKVVELDKENYEPLHDRPLSVTQSLGLKSVAINIDENEAINSTVGNDIDKSGIDVFALLEEIKERAQS